jgi:1-acyl-sn-glycerol-3-phosphate acyltransferase
MQFLNDEMNASCYSGASAVEDSGSNDHPSELAGGALPRVWHPLAKWFTYYSRWYIRKHFNSLGISRSSLIPGSTGLPIVLYANHPGWWDPLVGLILKAKFFPDYTLFAPIEAAALRRYKILSKIGFFGVDGQSRRGVLEFFKTARAILHDSNHLLAITPHGRFADVRERPVLFQRGLGVLAARVRRALFIPVAIEYTFWDQRRPEIFCRFGESTEVRAESSAGLNAWHWTAVFERRLEIAQDALAKEVCHRDPDQFEYLMTRGIHRKDSPVDLGGGLMGPAHATSNPKKT